MTSAQEAAQPAFNVLPFTNAPCDSTDREMLAHFVGHHARPLLQKFGSLSRVLGGDAKEIERIAGREAARMLAMIHEAAIRMTRADAYRRPVITSWSSLLAYARVQIAGEPREQFRVMFLDKKNQLIADEVMGPGTIDHAPVYPREVMRRALELSASAVILVHNHPSGDPTPSAADIDMTRQVVEAGRPLKVAVHDHIVVAAENIASLKALGLF